MSRITTRQIEREINSLITIDLPDGEFDAIVSTVEGLCETEHELGYNDGKEDGDDEGYKRALEDAFDDDNPQLEKLNTNYAVAQFADCKTLSDFQDKLKEITLRSYNFMT